MFRPLTWPGRPSRPAASSEPRELSPAECAHRSSAFLRLVLLGLEPLALEERLHGELLVAAARKTQLRKSSGKRACASVRERARARTASAGPGPRPAPSGAAVRCRSGVQGSSASAFRPRARDFGRHRLLTTLGCALLRGLLSRQHALDATLLPISPQTATKPFSRAKSSSKPPKVKLCHAAQYASCFCVDPPALPCLHDDDLIMLSRCLIVVEGREPCATLLHVLEDGSDLRHLVLLARGKGLR